MFDIGWSEMAVIMLVALIVIGPKDLPKVARTIGRWTGRARALARDFQRSIDDMAREAELDEIKKSIDRTGRMDLRNTIRDAVDPKGELKRAFEVEDKPKRSLAAKPTATPAKIQPPASAVEEGAVTTGSGAGAPAEAGTVAATPSDAASSPRS